MPDTLTHVSLSELVLDYDIYPRMQVDPQHARYMHEALQAGVQFPALVVDRESRRVTDGFHRIRAYREHFGADYQAECILRDYADEAAMFLDAMRLNATHGRPLTSYDRTRCSLRCKHFNIAATALAQALGMSRSALTSLAEGRVATVNRITNADCQSLTEQASETLEVFSQQEEVPIKRTIQHKAGCLLTADQEAANRKLSGMNQQFYVNQLLLLIENDLLDVENEALMERLAVLSQRLDAIFAAA